MPATLAQPSVTQAPATPLRAALAVHYAPYFANQGMPPSYARSHGCPELAEVMAAMTDAGVAANLEASG